MLEILKLIETLLLLLLKLLKLIFECKDIIFFELISSLKIKEDKLDFFDDKLLEIFTISSNNLSKKSKKFL